ncbi:MAG: hypothetical protein QM831_33630 [Kofleriaceae bacterium]
MATQELGQTATATTATQAIRATVLVAILVAAVNLVSLGFDPRDHTDKTVFFVDLCHGLLALVVAICIARCRPHSLLKSELGFAVVTLPFAIGLWLPAIADLNAGHVSEPLLPHHFLLLGIAIGAPTWRSGLALLVLFAVHALALGHVLATGTDVATLAHEPWMTLLLASMAGLMLYTRNRRRQLEQRVAAAEERARMLVDVARMLLSLRDRANTPLQTIEIAVALLDEDGHSPEQIKVMKRALARLASVQQTLSKSGAELAVIAGDAAMSPGDLEQSLRELLRSN